VVWEGYSLKRVAWDEPGGFHIVFIEELEEAADADGAGEVAATWELQLRSSCIDKYALMSEVESSPLYEPNQPATASMSTP
jgi:hypothetical protein